MPDFSDDARELFGSALSKLRFEVQQLPQERRTAFLAKVGLTAEQFRAQGGKPIEDVFGRAPFVGDGPGEIVAVGDVTIEGQRCVEVRVHIGDESQSEFLQLSMWVTISNARGTRSHSFQIANQPVTADTVNDVLSKWAGGLPRLLSNGVAQSRPSWR